MHVVWLAIIVVRVVAYFLNKQAGQSGRPAPGWAAGINRIRFGTPRVFGFVVRVGLLLVAWLVYVDQQPGFWLYLCGLGVFPEAVSSTLLVPSGIPYVSYYFTRVLHPQTTLGETRGGAVFNELRARLRWGWLLSPAALEPLARQLLTFTANGTDSDARGASLAARAMLDALSGDGDRARELFAVVQSMSWRHAPRSVRVYAQAWLLGDAARRGAYQDVIRLSWHGPYTARRVFMRGAARSILGQSSAPPHWKLTLLWLFAPGRRHALSLLKLALRSQARPEIVEDAHDFAAAKRTLFELLRLPRGHATRGELTRVARAWDNVFESGQLRELLSARRVALQGTFEIETVESRFERQVVAQLTALLPGTLPDAEPERSMPSPLLSAMDLLQGELLGEVEDLTQALPRGSARTTDDLTQHWRTWARIRFLAQQIADTLPERAHLVYPSMGLVALNHGAWLYNSERARVVAHDVFRYLASIAPKGDPNWKTISQNAKLSA